MKLQDSNLTTLRGIEQGRAKFAYDCVREGIKEIKDKEKLKTFASLVKRIPMLIKTNGIGTTFAYIKSKIKKSDKEKSKPYELVYNKTKEWLTKDSKQLIEISDDQDLVEAIISLDSTQYRFVTIELLAFFNWFKRFVEGLIEDDN